MNVTNKVLQNEEYREKYLNTLGRMSNEIEMFKSFQKQISDTAKAKQKRETKSKKGKDTIVSEATSKEDIRKLIATLKLKVTEVLSGDEDDKVKNIRVNSLNQKIASLERILSNIQRQELEKQTERSRKKYGSERVHLTKDDLTLSGNDKMGTLDASIGNPSTNGTVDIASGISAAVTNMVSAQNIDLSI